MRKHVHLQAQGTQSASRSQAQTSNTDSRSRAFYSQMTFPDSFSWVITKSSFTNFKVRFAAVSRLRQTSFDVTIHSAACPTSFGTCLLQLNARAAHAHDDQNFAVFSLVFLHTQMILQAGKAAGTYPNTCMRSYAWYTYTCARTHTHTHTQIHVCARAHTHICPNTYACSESRHS